MSLIKGTVRRENGVIENMCEHGVGHPAFGSADYWWRVSGREDEDNPLHIHGCDGCCRSNEWKIEDLRNGVIIGNKHLVSTQRALKVARSEIEFLKVGVEVLMSKPKRKKK